MARFSDVNTSSFFRVKDPSLPLDFCTQPNVTWTELSHLSNCSDAHFNGMYQECQSSDRIIYEPFEFDTTIATDFHLVCDQQYKVIVCLCIIINLLATARLIFYRWHCQGHFIS